MILYHTSTLAIPRPDTLHSRQHLDFGQGFYLTALKEQALRYGERFLRRNEPAVMNVYEFDEVLDLFTRKVFDSYDGEWLDYVSACRKGEPHIQYDIIEGGIADDNVFNTIDLYFSGIYTREQALDQLQYKKPNHQVCITSQQLIERHLHYIDSETIIGTRNRE